MADSQRDCANSPPLSGVSVSPGASGFDCDHVDRQRWVSEDRLRKISTQITGGKVTRPALGFVQEIQKYSFTYQRFSAVFHVIR